MFPLLSSWEACDEIPWFGFHLIFANFLLERIKNQRTKVQVKNFLKWKINL